MSEEIDWSTCHCGQPADGHLAGYCAHCSSVRCDAFPDDCGTTEAERVIRVDLGTVRFHPEALA